MALPKKTDEKVLIALLASTGDGNANFRVDQFKMAGLLGVKKTTVEPWVKDFKSKVDAINKQGKADGLINKDGTVNKDMVDSGRGKSDGAKKYTTTPRKKKGDEDGENGLHGIQGGRITKKKGGAKKGSLAIAGGEDGEDATKF